MHGTIMLLTTRHRHIPSIHTSGIADLPVVYRVTQNIWGWNETWGCVGEWAVALSQVGSILDCGKPHRRASNLPTACCGWCGASQPAAADHENWQ